MNTLARTLIFLAALLAGCRATRDVAVTSYHVTRGVAVGSYRVATAPVHYALRRNKDESSTATTTETTSSDVAEPNQYTPPPEVSSVPHQQPRYESAEVQSLSQNAAPRVTRKETTQAKPKPSPSSRASASQGAFPTAKSVPGKPGYVFSPFDSSGRYVDVSGYAPGTKVKDPWTDKIFIVP
jgi:hypothetical protein